MADDLLSAFRVPTRDETRDTYLRDYKIRNPAGDISKDTAPWIDASVFADQMTGLNVLAKRAAARGLIRGNTGADLDEVGLSLGLPRRGPVGATGFVRVTTSTGGAQLFAGDELRHKTSGKRYIVTRGRLYVTGDLVPIAGFDTGTETNQPPGTVLAFTSGRPGLGSTATVASSAGVGLRGGAPGEDDEAYQTRLEKSLQERAQSGNEADYARAVRETPGASVEEAFVYPCVLGPGTVGIAFTVAADPGGSRRPSDAQIALVEQHLAAEFPGDDMVFVASIASDAFTLALRVGLSEAATPFVDPTPWPPYAPPHAPGVTLGHGAVVIASDIVHTATSFTLKTTNNVYTGAPQPAPGGTLGFFVQATGKFVQKRIASVTGTGPWAITVDTTNGASDTDYAPRGDQRAMPYSDTLDALARPVLAFVARMGPSEMVTWAAAQQLRQRRVPFAPAAYPIVVDNRIQSALLAMPEVESALPLEGFTHVPPPGALGSVVSLGELADLAFFP